MMLDTVNAFRSTKIALFCLVSAIASSSFVTSASPKSKIGSKNTQPISVMKTNKQTKFKTITVNMRGLQFTGQRPEPYKTITVNMGALMFTGQRPDSFKTTTVNMGTLKFTGQRPDLFETITVKMQSLKFTGKGS